MTKKSNVGLRKPNGYILSKASELSKAIMVICVCYAVEGDPVISGKLSGVSTGIVVEEQVTGLRPHEQ